MAVVGEPPGGRGGPGAENPIKKKHRRFPRINAEPIKKLLGIARREQPFPGEDQLSPIVLEVERQRLDEARQRLNEAREEVRVMNEKLLEQSHTSDQEISRLNELVESLKAQIAKLEADKHGHEIVEFQETVRALREKRIQLEEDHRLKMERMKEHYIKKIAEQKEMLESTMQNLEDRMEDLNVSQDLYTDAADLLIQTRQEAAVVNARNDELEKNIAILKEQLKNENDRNIKLTSEIHELRDEIKELIRIIRNVSFFVFCFLLF
jgi:chromosome segregation ATPase